MTKQEEFLWIVQTVILANNMRLVTEEDNRYEDAHIFSATGTFIVCDEAVRASKLIPKTMSVRTAASEFCTFMLDNLRKIEEKAYGKPMDCPYWFLRSGAEHDDLLD